MLLLRRRFNRSDIDTGGVVALCISRIEKMPPVRKEEWMRMKRVVVPDLCDRLGCAAGRRHLENHAVVAAEHDRPRRTPGAADDHLGAVADRLRRASSG